MFVFSPIPDNYLAEMQRIERVSNPYPWQAESLADAHQNYAHLGIFDDTTLMAFALYRCVADEAEIIHLVCDKPHQGKGHANALLRELHQQLSADGIAQLFLEVRDNNTRAKHVYQQLGFSTVGRRPNYYGGRHDALIQRLVL